MLTAADAERYREIFDFQERGRFQEADRLIGSLNNKVLMGHVLAQRYLHPSFRAKYSDLKSWLAQYSDHPDAGKVYALALKKRGGAPLPHPPTYSSGNLPDTVELQAFASAARAAQGPWDSGLERFRAGKYAEAAQQFEKVAMTPKLSPWTASAGAFWAARSYLRAGEPDKVNHWMTVAAQQPRTFYGLLALHSLGVEPPLNWKMPGVGDEGFKQVLNEASGKRALALIEAQDNDRAERELLGLRPNASNGELLALAAISQEAHLPALSMKIGRQLIDKGISLDAALFPIPGWQPEGGFRVDRALVYALMRQESAFNPQALSPVGARGLMQLMPATAGFIANDKRLATKSKTDLFDPTLNITLGQRYVAHLLADRGISNDVIVMTAAYNGGPGNVAKWQRNVDYKDDPLLYIATIPAKETRQFIERVFANLWIYRTRLGQPAPELIALAEGKWPLYAALDSSNTSVAERFVGEDGTVSSGDYGRLPNGGN
ncbi:MAG TPA: lytic transglycosylase domain-containing protein [Alphaproteobacteria bacterium]|nr:lytic transglycosylase domain-containing protein [Alphaproteobacteria bacterium]